MSIKKIISESQFITINGTAYTFPNAALVVDKPTSGLGAKLKMEPVAPKGLPVFLDLYLTDQQRVELRYVMDKELGESSLVDPHENFVVTGNLVVNDGFTSPKISIQSMQVMRRLYAYEAMPIPDVELLYIVCDQKIAVLVDRSGNIMDRQRIKRTSMNLDDLLNQLYNCSVVDTPLDVKLDRGDNRHTLLLPRMLHGWHAQVATVIRDFIKSETKNLTKPVVKF
jgi:hypothetical protein